MRRFLVALLALLACTSTAHAASISVDVTFPFWSGEDVPGPGDTVVLTFTATANAGEMDWAAFGALSLSGDLQLLSRQQAALQSFGGVPWVLGGDVGCVQSRCVVFNQLGTGGLTPVSVTNTPLVIATLTFELTSAYSGLHASWNSDFQFFGTETPGDICILAFECPPVIPEPATGSLLGLGLLALAAARRRRHA